MSLLVVHFCAHHVVSHGYYCENYARLGTRALLGTDARPANSLTHPHNWNPTCTCIALYWRPMTPSYTTLHISPSSRESETKTQCCLTSERYPVCSFTAAHPRFPFISILRLLPVCLLSSEISTLVGNGLLGIITEYRFVKHCLWFTIYIHTSNSLSLPTKSVHPQVMSIQFFLMIVIDSFHGRYKERLKNKAELAFTAKHNHVEKIPFKIEMNNLGTTFAEWADEMKIDVPRGGWPDGVNNIGSGRIPHTMEYACDQYGDGDMINTLRSDQTCTVCGMNRHDLENCHLMINNDVHLT
jgi:hypothetical protein